MTEAVCATDLCGLLSAYDRMKPNLQKYGVDLT